MTSINRQRLMMALAQALALRKQGRRDEARNSALTAVRADPRFVEGQRFLGNLAIELGDLNEAVSRFTRALILAPGEGGSMYWRSAALHDLHRLEEAANWYRRARTLLGADVRFHHNRGNLHQDLEDHHQSNASHKRTILLTPSLVEPGVNLANTLTWMGRFDEAKTIMLRCWLIDRKRPATYETFCRLSGKDVDPRVLEGMWALLEAPDLSVEARRFLNFAAAEYLLKQGEPARAFVHLERGHKARAEHLDQQYKLDVEQRILDLCRELFTQARLDTLRRPGPVRSPGKPSPIFVVGMPRSGTTLTEQILASHSQVRAAGELTAISAITTQIFDHLRPDVTRKMIRRLSVDHLAPLAESYLNYLNLVAPGAPFVTDKMPHNFRFLWLIGLLFPEAPIIHCTRNPIDNCLSVYLQDFQTGHAYADDLRTLGHHYRNHYRPLMALWEEVMPGRILTMSYEEMIADPERKAREMLEFCGLPFEEGCLAFEGADRLVRTASATQVRKGIYRSSSGRWRAYEAELAPLIEALGPIALEA